MSDFFPGSPNWDSFWDRRPGGSHFTLNPLDMDAYDIGWLALHAGTMASWTHKTGMGISLNTLLGEVLFPTVNQITHNQYGRAFAHTRGASPSFTTGVMTSSATLPVLGAAVIIGGSAYVAYKIHTDPAWQRRARKLGSGMDFSAHFG